MDNGKQLGQRDIALMSDDELSNLDLSILTTPEQVAEVPTETPAEDLEPQPEEVNEEIATPDTEPTPEEPTEPTDSEVNPEPTAPQDEEQPADVKQPEQEHESTESEEPDVEVDYKAFYEKVTGSFKANGRDFAITNPDDIIAMMQRGANYAKKMAGLKPSMRLLRTLDNHGIDEEKLGFLIDLHNKNPEAISKLIQESGADVYSLDAEKAKAYQPKNNLASDMEVELEHTIQDLSSSPSFQRTLDVVTKAWDARSQGEIAQKPAVLRWLDSHMSTGIYDRVAQEVERLRAIGGHIDGLSDLEAYTQVGNAMNAQGLFNQPTPVKTPVAPQVPTHPVPVAPRPVAQPQTNQELNAKRRAASTPRPVTGQPKKEFNPLLVSDEELMGMFEHQM